GAALRVRGGHRGWPRQPTRCGRGQPARRPARQLRQGALPRAVVLHALRADGGDPGAAAHRPLRPLMIVRRALLAVAAIVVLAVLAPLLPPQPPPLPTHRRPLPPAYPLTLLPQALIVGILAMSLDVLLGYTGLTSLGHAAYFGVGAYAVAIMTTEKQAGLISCLVVGVLLAAATAAVFGLLAIRATGTYFLMITLALGMVIWGLAFR